MERTRRVPEQKAYLIPGALVHWLIGASLTGIVTIGFYMVVWGINDAAIKVEILTRLTKVEDLVELHDSYRKQSDKSVAAIEKLEKDVHRLEDQVYGNGD